MLRPFGSLNLAIRNAILPNGVFQPANLEIGIPGSALPRNHSEDKMRLHMEEFSASCFGRTDGRLQSCPARRQKNADAAVAKQIAAAAESEAIKISSPWSSRYWMTRQFDLPERMDETQLASVQIAQGKAHTALASAPTKALEDAVAGDVTLYCLCPEPSGGRRIASGNPRRKNYRLDRR